MKNLLIDVGVFSLNLVVLIVLQILPQFAVFFFYGEGESVDKQYNQWIVIFATIQILVIVILYLKKVLYHGILPVIIIVATVIAVCLYSICHSS